MRSRLFTCTALLACVVMSGCQQEYRSDAKKLAGVWSQGDYQAAATLAYKDAKEEAKHKKNRVIYFMEGGRAAQAAGDYETSIECFDHAFVDTYPYMKETPEATVSEAIVTTVTNNTTSRYRGTPNDRIMLHASNALNFMAMGDMDHARVELNRGVLWTEDAEYRYGKAMDLARKKNRSNVDDWSKETDRDIQDDSWANDTSSVMHDNTSRIVNDHYDDLPDRSDSNHYINPWALHLDAVFRLTRGEDGYGNDFSMAEDSLEELRAISPQVMPQLRSELEWASQGTPPPPTTWIYFMNGMGPYLEQITIPMPLPLSGGFTMPTLALPDMKFNEAKLDSIQASTDEGHTTRTRVLANTAAISASQFKERLPIIISQEAVRATGKAIATYVAMRAAQDNSYMAFIAVGALIYQVGSAQADLRCWRTMPADIQTAHLPTPENGILSFTAPDGRSIGSVELTPDESHIVVVSLPSPNVPQASIMPIQLTGEREEYVPVFSLKPPVEEDEPESKMTSTTTAEIEVDETESTTTKATS